MAGVQGAEQRGELGWRGRAGKGDPAARQPVRRGQPGAHCAQQARPARQRLGAAGFFPASGGVIGVSTGGVDEALGWL